jgi:hypothetical protein
MNGDKSNDKPTDAAQDLMVDHNHDRVDRRGFLKCMAWAGTGTLCVMKRGQRRTAFRADQRQPHGFQQGSQSRCGWHAKSGG